MKISQICFPEARKVVYEIVEKDITVGPRDVLIRTLYTAISAGTELAKFTGLQETDYPFVPGNRSVGQVVEAGAGVRGVMPGDRVFCHTRHVSHAKTDRFFVRVPDDVESCYAPLVGLGLVAMTAIRVGRPELGDRAAVIGMGAIGNLCAQLLRNAGVEVIGIDTVAERLEKARRCGVPYTINPKEQDVHSQVMEVTDDCGVEYVVEVSGNPAAMETVRSVAAKQAEVILLGSPRGAHETDITPLLNAVHLWRPHGSISMHGAHEWRYPLYPDGFTKHSMKRNAEIFFRMMADGRLNVKDVVSHILKPKQAPTAYDGLLNHKDEYLGVLFDWTGEEVAKE